MFRADFVVDASEPGLQVAEDEMDQGEELLSQLRVAAFGDGEVPEAAAGEAGIAGPVVGDGCGALRDGEADTAGAPASPSLFPGPDRPVGIGPGPPEHLDGGGHQRLL